ncbi:hypothetical protein BB560_001222 [Smittium megazygosporum]|nr:hypothetical protein BB560_001222 [Smittium megazygosporum]
MFLVQSLSKSESFDLWTYPEGEHNPPQLNPTCVCIYSQLLAFSVYYTALSFFTQRFHFVFPLVSQNQIINIKKSVYSSIKSSFEFGARLTFWFFIFYSFFGSITYLTSSNLFSQLYRTVNYEVDNPIYKISIIVTILFQSILTSFVLDLSFLLYNSLMTKPANLSSKSSNPQKALIDGLNLNGEPLFQYWTFMELYQISKTDQSRRKKIYFDIQTSSSLPWDEVCKKCLEVIRNSSNSTSGFLEKASNDKPLSSTRSVEPKKPTESSVNTSENITIIEKVLNSEIVKSLVKYFQLLLASRADSYEQFANLKTQIYSIRILSNFVVFSADEDKYGQVLKSIPMILDIMLTYLDVLVKLSNKANRSQNLEIIHSNQSNLDRFNIQTASKEIDMLIQVLRSSIYSIVVRFYDHMTDFDLNASTKKRLQYFMDFKA